MEREVGGICGRSGWDIEGGWMKCRIGRRFVVEAVVVAGIEPFEVLSLLIVGYG